VDDAYCQTLQIIYVVDLQIALSSIKILLQSIFYSESNMYVVQYALLREAGASWVASGQSAIGRKGTQFLYLQLLRSSVTTPQISF